MLAEMTGANEKYTTKRYINVHIAFIIQKSYERFWHVEKIFENVGFPKETKQNLQFIEEYVTTSKFSYIYIDRLESSMLNIV